MVKPREVIFHMELLSVPSVKKICEYTFSHPYEYLAQANFPQLPNII